MVLPYFEGRDWVRDQRRLLLRREIEGAGIKGWTLGNLVEQGELLRLDHGLYLPKDVDFDPLMPLAEAALKFPHGVVCRMTAARLHEVTTHPMHQVEMAVPSGSQIYPNTELYAGTGLKSYRWRPDRLQDHIETIYVMGVPVRTTTLPRTVIEVLLKRGREETGVEVLELALQKGVSIQDLHRVARDMGHEREIEPYLAVSQKMMAR